MFFFKLFPILSALAVCVSPSLSMSAPVAGDAVAANNGPRCTHVLVPLTITANNARTPLAVVPLLDLFELIPLGSTLVSVFNIVANLVNLSFTARQSGAYNIAGTYCEPEVYIPERENTIQFLAHPATYDRFYWFGALHPGVDGTPYSWVSFASKLGYPTFSFDRLGNGMSDHPNSITVVQCPAQAATVHELVKLARAGAPPFPRQFHNIVFVGASLGSVVGNVINVQYPDDFNSTILCGFSKFWANAVPGFTATAELLPATLTDNAKYAFLNGDNGYLIANSLSGVEYLLYYGPYQYYDPNFIALDYAARGTITIGEAITGALGISVAEAYTGSILVLNGNQDVVFCGTFDLPVDGPGNCKGTGILAKTQVLYPRAKRYSWFAIDNAGHCWQHQYTAQAGFSHAHNWLEAQGF